jgi:hypothetical protein
MQSDISSKAHDLHFRAIVVDTHEDTSQRLLSHQFDLGARTPRMKDGGLGALFFSIWTPGTVIGPQAIERALDQIDAVRQQVALHQKVLGGNTLRLIQDVESTAKKMEGTR